MPNRRPGALIAPGLADSATLDAVALKLGMTREGARLLQGRAFKHARELLAARVGEGPARDLARDGPRPPPIIGRKR
jgi:hypothetical protein